MNDHNKVFGYCFVPIDSVGHELVLLGEEIDIAIGRSRLQISKTYSIQNQGESGSFEFGAICQTKLLHSTQPVCPEVTVDDHVLEGVGTYGVMTDKGAWVKSRTIPLDRLMECERHNDGTICGYYWQKFSLSIDKNRTQMVTIAYSVDIDPTKSLIYTAIRQIAVYSEKFWANDSIPLVQISVSLEGNTPLSKDDLMPTGAYAKYSAKPDTAIAGAVVWTITNYNPIREPYEYGRRLVHPNSINMEHLEEMLVAE